MKRAAIYARVSTHDGQDPEMQLKELREYCARRGWEIVREYVDKGISGAKEHRPSLDALLADCHKRAVDAVVCMSELLTKHLHDWLTKLYKPNVNGYLFINSKGKSYLSDNVVKYGVHRAMAKLGIELRKAITLGFTASGKA
jgi:predicted site-specific integrase-resolvase